MMMADKCGNIETISMEVWSSFRNVYIPGSFVSNTNIILLPNTSYCWH